MSEMKNLLAQSINEFKDKVNNADAIPCTYLPGANGLAYLLQDVRAKKTVSVAIHFSAEQEQREDGIYDSGYCAINTQVDLFAQFTEAPNFIIINYKGFTLGINKSGEFNSEAATYHYTGEALLNRNEAYIIMDEDDAATLILSDSTTKWLDLATEFTIPVYPSFVSVVNKKDAFLTVSIPDSKGLNHVRQISDTKYRQYKQDSVRLHLVNSTLDQAQEIARQIFMAPSKYATFGIKEFPSWKTITDYTQSSFGIKQNIRFMDLTINYQLESDSSDTVKYFKQIAATINSVKIETPTI